MSLHSFCPSCDRIPYIEINTKEVYLNCDHCQFNSLNNYLQQVKDIKPSIVAQSNRKIDKLKEVIKLAHNHLTNYFSKMAYNASTISRLSDVSTVICSVDG